jgi:hypothetical protein
MTYRPRPSTVRVCAHRADPALTAVVVRQTPLHYADGADPATDRPAHVRAGSSLARVPGGIAVIQDDANFIAVVATDGSVSCITLPADATGQRQFDDNRGNKRRKLDLEACVSMATGGGTLLVALGSGSRPSREQVALVEWTADSGPVVTVTNAAGMYAALRAVPEFAGSQLNLEGAVQVATRLRLFGRGNGATRGDLRPVNATCDLDWPALLAHLRAPGDIPAPAPQRVVQHELGRLQGVALGFTDATTCRDAVLYTASAERTNDAVDDGQVMGSVVGVIPEDDAARWAVLRDVDGNPFAGKIEGLLEPQDGQADLFAIVDVDDAGTPSLLCEVELRGPWFAADRPVRSGT